MTESVIDFTRNILVACDDQVSAPGLFEERTQIRQLKTQFCGVVCTKLDELKCDTHNILYLAGDIYKILEHINSTNNVPDFINIICDVSYSSGEEQSSGDRVVGGEDRRSSELRRSRGSEGETRVTRDHETIFNEWTKKHPALYHLYILLDDVPISIHGLGVYYRNIYGWRDILDPLIQHKRRIIKSKKPTYFKQLTQAHNFQSLTESNKEGSAYRKGVYLSQVTEKKGELFFNLLRCSTNLDGPTERFKVIDTEILSSANVLCEEIFTNPAELNHVLAQVYHNKVILNEKGEPIGEKKATISAHSDKTKDMPENAIIAFASFYEADGKVSKEIKRWSSDPYDLKYGPKGVSVLSRLLFKKKGCVSNLKNSQTVSDSVSDSNLPETFEITLYPNSLFVIPMSTNRMYTHEIRAPILPADKIPTRLGYVMRCSETLAAYNDDGTFVCDGDIRYQLVAPSDEDVSGLKGLYRLENVECDVVRYPPTNFSLNLGDYMKPHLI